MFRRSPSCGSSLDSLSGKRFPAFAVKPKEPGDNYSVCYAQFTFGLGVGDTKEEAVKDAEYVLALGLHMRADQAPIPEPVAMKDAKELARNTLSKLGLREEDIEWVTVEVKPEAIKDEVWD
ncbi:hypothetical protein CHLRE_01g054200v5 [Chlamydomonas reinhardtii]|uniref:Uncharacterized protein n=1 Tax=Chlamydomonas reinhardtii TaxID=3055 RepID=A8HNQ8_CHLRE|nr:uncharacterized protein CHLRE_01g054200v5 [Chlamydomonas reinhardtii]PNW89002.1 hypothetical protein CHLRE_01g054200v5 [Chlamydomonas reinhardtii]|eukprot:XP_001689808.1 predicted protein [Chlamydomonas reinhardtii]